MQGLGLQTLLQGLEFQTLAKVWNSKPFPKRLDAALQLVSKVPS